MKKAFTLAEVLITLAVLGIIASILIPMLDNAKPDRDKIFYKKAMYNLQIAMANVMNDAKYTSIIGICEDAEHCYLRNLSSPNLCSVLADQLNTTGGINCGSSSSYQKPNFVTTDGIRFWGFPSGEMGSDTITIKVDRKFGPTEQSDRFKNGVSDGLRIDIRKDGKISTAEGYTLENSLLEDSMNVTEKGRYD